MKPSSLHERVHQHTKFEKTAKRKRFIHEETFNKMATLEEEIKVVSQNIFKQFVIIFFLLGLSKESKPILLCSNRFFSRENQLTLQVAQTNPLIPVKTDSKP